MCRISVFYFTIATTLLVALLLPAQLLPSSSSPTSHSSNGCSSGIAGADLIIGELADDSKTGAAVLKVEIARIMMHEGDFKGCAAYIDSAMRMLRAGE